MTRRSIWLLLALGVGLGAVSCKRVMVPPAIDLVQHDALGIIQFEVNGDGGLAPLATRRFVEAVTRDQFGVRVVELGEMTDVLSAVRVASPGPEAFKAMGEKYGVRSVFVGRIAISDVRPRIEIGLWFPHVSASADVEATMTCRLVETGLGATVWSGSAAERRQIGNVTIHRDFFSFDAQDPEAAYGALVRSLVQNTTKDFRVTWKCVRR